MKTSTQDTPKFAYLRNRPYLVIEFYRVPAINKGAQRVRTERKDWMTIQANVSVDEYPSVVDRISDKIMTKAGIIIDLLEDKVVKNSLSDTAEAVFAHFTSKYASAIEQGRSRWINGMMGEFNDFESFRRNLRLPKRDTEETA